MTWRSIRASAPAARTARACRSASAERTGGAFTPQIENDRIADTDRHYTHGTRLAFSHVFRTKEFDGQRRAGRYGALSLSVRL